MHHLQVDVQVMECCDSSQSSRSNTLQSLCEKTVCTRANNSQKNPSQGQQAVVKAALSILLNKAVLHGCPLPRTGKCEQSVESKRPYSGHSAKVKLSNVWLPL